MKRIISLIRLIWILPVTLFITGCEKTPDENLPTEPVEISLTSSQTSLVNSGNSFAFDIFREIVESSDEGKNIIISPLSISYALSMTLNGADGTTRDAMIEALRVNGITPDEINIACRDLTKALLSVDKRVIMNIANSVWTENDFAVKQEFINILNSHYDAESRSFNINDPGVPDQVNAWIEDKTNGLIKDMLDKLNDNTVMLLINAIYFKGKWKMQFDPDDTENRAFYLQSGSISDVPTMSQKEDFKVYDGNGFLMGEFPYGQGNFVMDIILPDMQNGIASLLPSITDISFSEWVNNLHTSEVELYLPRFKYPFKIQLKQVLTDMGMGIAFSDQADFTNIADSPPLLINEVTHQAFIETNEEGTEAAAATIVDIGVTSIGPSPIIFRANHPFIYLIREITTGAIIFMGVVENPSSN